MNNKSIVPQVCKTIISIVLIIVWGYIFCFLVLIGPPIWGVLLLILTTICLITYFCTSNKYRNLNKRIEDIEKETQQLKAEIQKIREELAEETVRRAMEKAESREKGR